MSGLGEQQQTLGRPDNKMLFQQHVAQSIGEILRWIIIVYKSILIHS